MKPKFVLNLRHMMIIVLLVCVAINIVIAFKDLLLFYIFAPITFILLIVSIYKIIMYKKDTKRFLFNMTKYLNAAQRNSLYDFPLPTLVCNKNRDVIWYNELFKQNICDHEDIYESSFDIITKNSFESFKNSDGVQLQYKNKNYRVYGMQIDADQEDIYIFYFCENTELIRIVNEYSLSRPVVMLIMVDNCEELLKGQKDSVRSSILGAIDKVLEDFISETTGFLRRLSGDMFVAVIEQRHLKKCIENKFDLLNKAREIKINSSLTVTLSIGVGHGSPTMLENENSARQALDMALGRGGDQVAVKTNNGYDFYGGVSKGIERRTKVKTRIIATALKELIESCDNVIIMGHKFGDLDCVGSSVGIAKAVKSLGKPAYITVDYKKNLATVLIDRLVAAGNEGLFIHPLDTFDLITPKTLLIITDTHNPEFLESPGVYEKCGNVVVIDHHRKMVNHIDNTVIFYHEPYASSASEMVAELIQYMGDGINITELEAEALLSGIMLDTKNFIIRTGVRTFEAAAYLKGLGADTVSVRKFFANTMDSYQKKSRLVSAAEIYKGCAIAIGDFQSDNIRVVASQAADELLGITDVKASFVIFQVDNTVNISARSLGDVNSQVIMEMLGGGGHLTMAACQIENINIEKGRLMLLEVIDKYFADKQS